MNSHHLHIYHQSLICGSMTLFLDPLPCHVYTFRETTTSNQLIWLIYWVLQTEFWLLACLNQCSIIPEISNNLCCHGLECTSLSFFVYLVVSPVCSLSLSWHGSASCSHFFPQLHLWSTLLWSPSAHMTDSMLQSLPEFFQPGSNTCLVLYSLDLVWNHV